MSQRRQALQSGNVIDRGTEYSQHGPAVLLKAILMDNAANQLHF
jgi:hypothetical protein